MDLHLTFQNGRMSGEGQDDIGRFTIAGCYDATSFDCSWTKRYVGAHEVYYEGCREGKGIWGRWDIGAAAHGGFHIWPVGLGDGDGRHKTTEEPVPAEEAPLLVGAPSN
jgi:hypothetical protein